MRLNALTVILVALMTMPASAAGPTPVGADRPRLSMRDVFRLRGIGEFAIRPDGKAIAYVRKDPDPMADQRTASLWIVEVASGAELQLATAAGQPRWSVDGDSLAFVAEAPGGGSRLVVADRDGRRSRTVAADAGGFSSLAWSPTGHRIAFTRFVPDAVPAFAYPVVKPAGANWAAAPVVHDALEMQRDGEAGFTPGHMQVFVAPLSGGTPTQLTHGDTDASGPAWTHNGLALLYFAQDGDELRRSYLTSTLRRVDVSTGASTIIATPGIAPREVSVSPDGGRVALIASASSTRDYEPSGLYVMDLNGGGVRRLDAGLDREVGNPRFAPDGRSVLATYADGGATRLIRFDLDGRRTVLLDRLDGDYDAAGDGSVAYSAASPSAPPELAIRSAMARNACSAT